VTVELFTIQIVLDDGPLSLLDTQRVAALMAETEENLTDLLPPGYRARIRRWDNPGEDTE